MIWPCSSITRANVAVRGEPIIMALTFVPTPLGNLRDITLRSLDALRDAALIVAEDSRVARRLLSAYEIGGKEIWTYHEHNAQKATAAILERAKTERVAVVTDAGMPGISDPGIAIEVLPGAAAFVCAAVLSGFALRRFTFEGFPPRGATERRSAFERALASDRTSVWYEAPHRIHATLTELERLAPKRRLFLVRELSKAHEQQILGTAAEIRAALGEPVRGEITFVIEGAQQPMRTEDAIDLERTIDASLA